MNSKPSGRQAALTRYGEKIYTLKEPMKLHGQARVIEYLIDPATGCWNVVNHKPDLSRGGYNRIMRNNLPIGMHRYSYELVYGSIPDGLHCCHHCDNPQCINPEHLFLGTNADNVQDAVRKGRRMHKLIEADVRAIRTDKTSTQKKLGKRYGVSGTNIGHIKRGEIWKHVSLFPRAINE